MIADRKEIRSTYPEILSLENIRCILRISKRKAAWMLQNGIINCEISEKQTKQYRIRMDDLFEYLDKFEQGDPSVMTPIGRFNAKKTTRRKSPIIPIMQTKPPDDFRLWLEDEWFDKSDLLRIKDVAAITGYHENTVQRWMKEKRIRSVWTQQVLISSKTWLIDFYCEDAYRVDQKSEAQTELMRRYYGIT